MGGSPNRIFFSKLYLLIYSDNEGIVAPKINQAPPMNTDQPRCRGTALRGRNAPAFQVGWRRERLPGGATTPLHNGRALRARCTTPCSLLPVRINPSKSAPPSRNAAEDRPSSDLMEPQTVAQEQTEITERSAESQTALAAQLTLFPPVESGVPTGDGAGQRPALPVNPTKSHQIQVNPTRSRLR